MKIIIHEPIWFSRSVGVADHKITEDLEIEIDYKKLDGTYEFPATYFISKEKAKSYPIQTVKGVDLRIIPIRDLETK